MKALLIASALFPLSAFAAVPDYYCGLSELKEITESQEVVESLIASGRIVSIKFQNSVYQISTGRCQIEAKVEYLGGGLQPCPDRKITFTKKVCKSE
jgi:hypothetical protein